MNTNNDMKDMNTVDENIHTSKDLKDDLEEKLSQQADSVSEEDEAELDIQLPDKIQDIVDSAQGKKPFVVRLLNQAKLLWIMLKDPDFTMELSSKAIVVAGLLYFVSPLDLLPDVIPVIGLLDDATMLSIVISAVSGELDRYGDFLRQLKRVKNQNEQQRSN